MKNFFVILLLFAFSAQAQTDIGDATYLRKLSFHLRGLQPTMDEFKELQAQQTDQARKAFFDRKIGEYLRSTAGQERMTFRLSERFQVQTPASSVSAYNQLSAYDKTRFAFSELSEDSISDLFARMVRDNLPWDYLLTGKDYNLFPFVTADDNTSDPSEMRDFSFFGIVNPNLTNPTYLISQTNPVLPQPTLMHFASDDLRVSGVLTTPRFLSRYNTTNINRNRRRAAAVFRIFLCDPMVPIIPPPPDKKSAIINQAFMDDIDHSNVSEQQLQSNAFTISDAARHGADKKCAACHYKLDPMGHVFQNIGLALNPEPAKGVFTFTRANGEVVKKYLNGIGDLGAEVAKQPEYVECQVNWLWKQFIGLDVPLTAQRRSEMIQQFNQVERRTDDFVKVLVTTPEFRRRPVRNQSLSFAQIQPLVKRCDSCHSSQDPVPLPTLQNGDISSKTLMLMRFRLNLPEGNAQKMPLDWMNWDAKDLATVKRWIEEGAVGPDGVPKLSKDDLKGAQ